MNEAVGQVSDTMQKGKEITAEINKLSDKIMEIVNTVGKAMENQDNQVTKEIKQAVSIVNAGKAGIQAATNMVNGVIDRFVDINDLMEEWVESIKNTEEAIDQSDDQFDKGTTESVQAGIDGVVNSFMEMFDATEYTIENLKQFGSDIVELTKKEVQMADKAAEFARIKNPSVQLGFEFVERDEDSWEDFQLQAS